ncbi:unnamed protein product [Penicillium nalgiovense]|nr:unnamed protein product [Penicillium nalgiovense]
MAVHSTQAQLELPALFPGSQLNDHHLTEDLAEYPAAESRSVLPYLLEKSPEFRELSDTRQQGWETLERNEYFANVLRTADEYDENTAAYLHKFMSTTAREFDKATNTFKVQRVNPTPPAILDMCMVPGALLQIALERNPGARALAFSLPVSCGGYKSNVASNLNTKRVFLNLTMLAADMDVDQIPEGHEDAENFLPRQFEEGRLFDLVVCDGQVLREHSSAPYGENREARRMAITQLALGLQHLRPGGTMIALLHRFETWNTVNLIWKFHKISSVRLFKPKSCYTKRSTFYMVATNVESQRPEAIEAVKLWKSIWRIATFGSDEEYGKVILNEESSVETLLEDFAPELVKLDKTIWKTEADSLAKVPFMKRPE